MSNEGIDFEHYSATDQKKSSSSLHSITRHDVFHLFLSDNSKKDAATTAVHRKRITDLFLKKVLGAGIR